MFKSRKVTWLSLCSTFNPSSFGYISRKALPNYQKHKGYQYIEKYCEMCTSELICSY